MVFIILNGCGVEVISENAKTQSYAIFFARELNIIIYSPSSSFYEERILTFKFVLLIIITCPLSALVALCIF